MSGDLPCSDGAKLPFGPTPFFRQFGPTQTSMRGMVCLSDNWNLGGFTSLTQGDTQLFQQARGANRVGSVTPHSPRKVRGSKIFCCSHSASANLHIFPQRKENKGKKFCREHFLPPLTAASLPVRVQSAPSQK